MSKHSGRAVGPLLMFFGFSLLGIFVFFVQVDIGGQSSIPIDHMAAFLKRILSPYYVYILAVLAGCSVVSRFRNGIGRSRTDILFFVLALAGLTLSASAALRLLPDGPGRAVDAAVNATGNILCAIFVTGVFVPLLTEYGLVDFFSILCRPFMRRLFLTPGSSAVIGVSAFLGNYSVGHIVSRRMYDEGGFTEKEAVIVATGFSTCSIGLMINLVNYTGIMDHWRLYVATVLIVTFLTTAVVARLYPISRKRSTYKEGAAPAADEQSNGRIFHTALDAGVSRAAGAAPPQESAVVFLRQTMPLICEIAGASMCVISIGMLCAGATHLFRYVGALFYPLLRLTGLDASDALHTAECLGASLLEPVLAGVISDGWSGPVLGKWIISVVPYSAIIFFAGSIPSLWKSGIPCKIQEMLLIWLERALLGIVFTALLFRLACRIGLL